MASLIRLIALGLLLLSAGSLVRAQDADAEEVESPEDSKITYAEIRSCAGCSLNRMPEVKSFLYVDAPKYENVKVEYEHGVEPVVYWYDRKQRLKDLERLGGRSRSALNELFKKKGFVLKEENVAQNSDPQASGTESTSSDDTVKKDEL
eukprot:TRINITY_DN5301_c0_g1_i1.p1 TRINITY_DN5301_c0_g1~~TRINITY_DN5301_c0_g1_i1.p1  ORF type:complete len:149 (-),score=33.95 TRINITY_DN5301_c0_g1_i1:29-475(-)